MARETKTITVTFTRETVAEATIELPDGFDPMVDTLEDVALDWLNGHKDELEFSHDGIDIEIWNIEAPVDDKPKPPVPATVTLQRWNMHDYAEEVDEVKFDARGALDCIPLQFLPAFPDDFHDKGACDYGDDVFRAAVRIHAIRDWDGPFEFHVADDEAYAKYYDERAVAAGLPPVER